MVTILYKWPALSSQSSSIGCCLSVTFTIDNWQNVYNNYVDTWQQTISQHMIPIPIRKHLVSLTTAALIPLSGERLWKRCIFIVLWFMVDNSDNSDFFSLLPWYHLHGNKGAIYGKKTVKHQEVTVQHQTPVSGENMITSGKLSHSHWIFLLPASIEPGIY